MVDQHSGNRVSAALTSFIEEFHPARMIAIDQGRVVFLIAYCLKPISESCSMELVAMVGLKSRRSETRE